MQGYCCIRLGRSKFGEKVVIFIFAEVRNGGLQKGRSGPDNLSDAQQETGFQTCLADSSIGVERRAWTQLIL